MCKKSCLECKNYKHKESKVVFVDFCLKEIETPHHCDIHPDYFNKWWDMNHNKRRIDEDYIEPICYEPNEIIASLDEMIDLAKKILNK